MATLVVFVNMLKKEESRKKRREDIPELSPLSIYCCSSILYKDSKLK